MSIQLPDVPTSEQALEVLRVLTETFRNGDQETTTCRLCVLRGTLLLAAYVTSKAEAFFHESDSDDKPIFGSAGDGDEQSQTVANAVEDLLLAIDPDHELPMGASGPVRNAMFARVLQMLKDSLAELDLDISDVIKIVLAVLAKV